MGVPVPWIPQLYLSSLTYCLQCRYSKEWEKTVHRLGRWIDFDNGYKTLDPNFMESVWWVFRQLFDKGLIYKGFKVGVLFILIY